MNSEIMSKNRQAVASGMPLISIITVVKNGEKFIEMTIKSVISQTYPAIEYIVIDGDSQDNTLRIVKKYEKHISRWISEPDRSLYDAMNKGLKMAKGKYVWFMNAGDEIYDKTTLKRIFSTDKNADIYYGDTLIVDINKRKIGFFRGHRAPKDLTWKSFMKGALVCHQSFIIKKALASSFDYLNYPVSADTDWMIKGLKKAKRIINTQTVLSKFLTGGISTQHEFQTWIENYKAFKKNFGFFRNIYNHLFMAPNLLAYKLFKKRF